MPDNDLEPGGVVEGRYRLEETLGSGAFGTVWRAVDLNGGGAVALKVLHPSFRANSRVLERFVREAEVLGELDHPSIARLLSWTANGRHVAIALELVDGFTLADDMTDHAERGAIYSDAEVVSIVAPVAAALEHAHARGIVHRDLKPRNILISRSGGKTRVKVVDFGLAKILQADSSDGTTVGRLLGSVFYLPPEQVIGADVGPRADVFALGSIVFELLTLRRVWARDDEDRPLPVTDQPATYRAINSVPVVTRRIGSGLRPRPSQFRPGLSPGADAVVLRALSPEPSARWPRAGALARALAEALEPMDALSTDSLEALAEPTGGLRIGATRTIVDPRIEPAREDSDQPRTLPDAEHLEDSAPLPTRADLEHQGEAPPPEPTRADPEHREDSAPVSRLDVLPASRVVEAESPRAPFRDPASGDSLASPRPASRTLVEASPRPELHERPDAPDANVPRASPLASELSLVGPGSGARLAAIIFLVAVLAAGAGGTVVWFVLRARPPAGAPAVAAHTEAAPRAVAAQPSLARSSTVSWGGVQAPDPSPAPVRGAGRAAPKKSTAVAPATPRRSAPSTPPPAAGAQGATRALEDLERAVRELEGSPDDTAKIGALARRIATTADALPEPARGRVQREARRATFGGGAEALSAALRILRESQTGPQTP